VAMNRAIHIFFATPYLSSITRDQFYVHSPMPLDGAIAYAIYWQAVALRGQQTPTRGRADTVLMEGIVYPELRRVFGSDALGAILSDSALTEEIFFVSSGFPVHEGQPFIKHGARYVALKTGEVLQLEYETQPIRKRVDPQKLTSLGIQAVTKRGYVSKEGIDTSRGPLKAIDSKITTWRIFEYVWFAQVNDESLLRELLEVLKFQGMGKKRSAGFGQVVDYDIRPIPNELSLNRQVFAERDGQMVLLRPLPYDAIMRSQSKLVMTNLMVEFGCGYRPPYWSDRGVVVREGTMFRFL